MSTESNTSLEQLTSKMVHDVRTPLTILNMLAYTLEQKLGDSAEAKEEIKIFKDEIQKIEKLVSEYRENIRDYF